MTPAPRTILLTGASGFVGRHLMRALAAAFPDAAVLTQRINVQDAAAMDAAVRTAKPDVCIHLAAVAAIAAAGQAPDHAWQVNFHGTMHLAWALSRHAPDCQMLFASSADAYGASFRNGNKLDERAPLAPLNVYAETKATADLTLCGLAAQGLRVVRLRPFNHTGPGQSDQFVVAAFARQIARIAAGLQPPVLQVGNLEAQRDFLDVRDVCTAYVQCIARRGTLPAGTVLNLASGQARRIGDVLTDLAAIAGVSIQVETDADRVRPSDIAVARGDAALARERLGWRPTVPWTQTLEGCPARLAGQSGQRSGGRTSLAAAGLRQPAAAYWCPRRDSNARPQD